MIPSPLSFRPQLAALPLLLLLAAAGHEVAVASDGASAVVQDGANGVAARAFVRPQDQVIRLDSGRPTAYFQVEPVSGSFDIHRVFLRSMKLLYPDTNPLGASKILTVAAEIDRDTDRNGQDEIRVCFAKADLRRLFMDVAARSSVVVRVYGALAAPSPSNWFAAPVAIDVVGEGSFRIRSAIDADVAR